jgi:uncharacterized membrane protein YgcG
MFSEKFISELFKPQKMYSSTSTRQIFDRLAHSSIMRLNTSSMDKLYDLMTMGCKYQVVSCAHPLDLYQICLNHLDALRVLVRNAGDVSKLVENCVSHMDTMFSRMRIGDLHLLRYTLARFFQDRRVKVSLFLTDQLQAQDGSMIHTHGGKMPVGTDRPGTIRYFGPDGVTVKKEEFIKLPNSEHVTPTPEGIDITKPGRPCELGTNLYAKDRRKKGAAAAGGASASASTSGKSSSKSGSSSGGKSSSGPVFEPDEASKQAAKTELNALAQMIGGGARPAKEGEKFSIVNLFPDTQMDSGSGPGGEMKADIICFDVEDRDTRSAALAKKFGGLNVEGNGGEDEDLLDLMDKNASSGFDD